MKRVINNLVQLQELTEARAQREASMPRPQLSELNQSIDSLLESLPPQTASIFERLRKRMHLAIVPVAGDICSGCGLRLPVSLVHAVRSAEALQHCPNCSRLLYTPSETAPRRMPKRRSRFEAPPVGLARFSAPELMVPDLKANNAEEAIRALSTRMAEEQFIDEPDALALAALQREAITSTAVDHNLAFPHVRGVEGGGLTLALGIHKKGFRFHEENTSPTRVVFFMVIPTAASGFYLKLLAGLTQSFRAKEPREKLLTADTPEKLYKALLSATKKTIP